MKIRTSFVANSSSSSFLIAVKDVTDNPDYEQYPNWIKGIVKKFIRKIDDSRSIMKTTEELEKYYLDCYCNETIEEFFEDYPKQVEDYKKALSLINKGYTINVMWIDNNDESGQEFFSELPIEDEGAGIVLIRAGY